MILSNKHNQVGGFILCDDTGKPLPHQKKCTTSLDSRDTPTVTVTFAVDMSGKNPDRGVPLRLQEWDELVNKPPMPLPNPHK